MATTKFKIRGMRRISIPASSATIGCNIAALRVKVIGLAPCSLVRSQIHPFYRTVLRHRIPRSTSFERLVWKVALAVRILAVDDLRLLRVQHQLAGREAILQCAP